MSVFHCLRLSAFDCVRHGVGVNDEIGQTKRSCCALVAAVGETELMIFFLHMSLFRICREGA